jgi:drug/metabolite transporter (DMT)-like permease
MKHGGIWGMSIAMGLSGTIGLFVVMSGQPALTVVFFRCLIGAMVLLGWLYWQSAWQAISRRAVTWLLLGAIALIANWLCLFSAYRLSSISVATLVYHVQPFFLLLLTALVQKESLDWRKLPWLISAFVGVAMISGINFFGEQTQILMGVLLAVTAAFLYAVATLATRKLSGIPPAQIAGCQLLLGTVLLAPMTDFSHLTIEFKSWSSLLILGLVHTGLMYNLMYAAFQRLPANTIATLSFIYPLVAILVDLVFFDATLSTVQVVGILIILFSVIANQRGWTIDVFSGVKNLVWSKK